MILPKIIWMCFIFQVFVWFYLALYSHLEEIFDFILKIQSDTLLFSKKIIFLSNLIEFNIWLDLYFPNPFHYISNFYDVKRLLLINKFSFYAACIYIFFRGYPLITYSKWLIDERSLVKETGIFLTKRLDYYNKKLFRHFSKLHNRKSLLPQLKFLLIYQC